MELKKHYQDLFAEHGNSSHAVQYSDSASQFKRFEILQQIDRSMESVVDIGCGLGHLYEFLQTKNENIRYLGLDFVKEFIQAAQNTHGKDQVAFQVCDLYQDQIPSGYDYALLSGVFNNLMPDNWGFMRMTLEKMFAAANKGIAFNCMSTYVDYFDAGLFYVNPCEVFDFCKRELGRKVVLRNEYLIREGSIPFECTFYVYK